MSVQHHNGVLDVPGTIAFVSGIIMWIWNKLNIDHINSLVVLMSGILGLIFVSYKLIGVILDNKSKRIDLKIKERKLEETQKND